MLIEIVTHVYSPPGLDQYSQMLRVQAASLIHWPPETCHARLTVCYTFSDNETLRTINEISLWTRPKNVDFWFLGMQPGQLFRRAIGRNMRAKESMADVLWYTDCDYVFARGCLDDVARFVDPETPLSMPSRIFIHRDHATGDAELERMRHEALPKPDLSLFVEKRQGPCIGGIQLVGGKWARNHGYLDGTKWVDPVSEDEGFRSCRCDRAFRKHNQLSAVRLPIAGVRRCRHTKDGRDYALDGTKVGKAVW